MVAIGSSSLDVAWPADQERHADATFVEVALDAAIRAVAVEIIRIGSTFAMRTVVGGEDKHGVVGDTQ